MSNTNSILTLVAGLAVGATLGILLAPDSGKNTRQKLMKRGEKLRDDLTCLMEEGEDAMNEMKDKAQQSASNMGNKARETASQVKSDLSNAAQAAGRAGGASHV